MKKCPLFKPREEHIHTKYFYISRDKMLHLNRCIELSSKEEGHMGLTIINIGKVSLQVMFAVDPTVVRIIQDKSSRSGLA
jgi:hypothetical protein